MNPKHCFIYKNSNNKDKLAFIYFFQSCVESFVKNGDFS